MFLNDSYDPWYGDVLVYLQTQLFNPYLSRDEHRCIHHQAKNYLIIGNTLYHMWVDMVLCCCLVHEEVEHVLNDFHEKACGGHLSWSCHYPEDIACRILLAYDIQILYQYGS
jgi:hypothetical protein